MIKPIQVLVVDDSVVMRKLIAEVLEGDPATELCGRAVNGQEALRLLENIVPDVVVLDIEMPVMDGLTTMEILHQRFPHLPVLMFSSLTKRGASATMRALELGAADYATKPSGVGNLLDSIAQLRRDLLPRIQQLGQQSRTRGAAVPTNIPVPNPERRLAQAKIIAVGVSTGGPNALAQMLSMITPTLQAPMVIVQHILAEFSPALVERLQASCQLPVRLAEDGQPLCRAEILVAPGGFHTEVDFGGIGPVVRLSMAPPENSVRPAVDVLFRSVAQCFGKSALGVVMTGMGQDGLAGSQVIRDAGGQIISQDAETSLVWGMAGRVVEAGLADQVLPLGKLASAVEAATQPIMGILS